MFAWWLKVMVQNLLTVGTTTYTLDDIDMKQVNPGYSRTTVLQLPCRTCVCKVKNQASVPRRTAFPSVHGQRIPGYQIEMSFIHFFYSSFFILFCPFQPVPDRIKAEVVDRSRSVLPRFRFRSQSQLPRSYSHVDTYHRHRHVSTHLR